jgi:transposase-like protein
MSHEVIEPTQAQEYAEQPWQEPEFLPRQKATRKQYTAEYKLRILEEADRAREEGKISEMLRREGLRWSHLSAWRKQRDEAVLDALAPKKRGRKPSRASSIQERLATLERENRLLKIQLQALGG